LLSSLYLLDRLSDLPFLIRFGVVACLSAQGHSASVSGMRKFSMGAFATTGDFVKPRCAKTLDKLSDFPWHFFRFNLWRKLFYAKRPS
jgi:hypothetical protein